MEPVTVTKSTAPEVADPKTIWGVITASSVGTLIEWYDFYIFGSLAAAGIIGKQFFPSTIPRPPSSTHWLPSPRASSCGPSAPWCSGGSAT
jgi:hypothetical protein